MPTPKTLETLKTSHDQNAGCAFFTHVEF